LTIQNRPLFSEPSKLNLRAMSPHARLYLRASTSEQDAGRARAGLEAFARERGLPIVGRYVENESGASLKRPELFRLLADSHPGDVLLIEQVDRLSFAGFQEFLLPSVVQAFGDGLAAAQAGDALLAA
jgi:DNA invertase Pin-like site-specific DNA recombinase